MKLKIETIARSEDPSRVLKVSVGSKTLVTPTYFPALSGVMIQHSTAAIAQLITNHSYPRMLVSAYDLSPKKSPDATKLLNIVERFQATGGFLMMDSGWYESSWLKDSQWNQERLRKTLREVESDLYFGFDVILHGLRRNLENAARHVLSSTQMGSKREFVPVFHARDPQTLVAFIRMFEKKHPDAVKAIAVSQRECGNNFEEKAGTIRRIRSILNQEQPGKLFHLLGCGGPLSLALFSFLGVDTFDSLDWLQRVADYNSWTPIDISQLTLLNCRCPACSSSYDNYLQRVFLHNLGFYQDFMARIRDWIRIGTIKEVLAQRLNRDPTRIGRATQGNGDLRN
jgi:queuine/archaeosine tRNA-ribosyltransferase